MPQVSVWPDVTIIFIFLLLRCGRRTTLVVCSSIMIPRLSESTKTFSATSGFAPRPRGTRSGRRLRSRWWTISQITQCRERENPMAVEQKRVCDVFPSRDARAYLLTLQVPAECGPNKQWEADLCDRAVKRLLKFIERGLSKPTQKQE